MTRDSLSGKTRSASTQPLLVFVQSAHVGRQRACSALAFRRWPGRHALVVEEGCGRPSRVSGETRVTSQHSASPSCVAPYATKSRRQRSSGSTPGAGVRTSHCCGTTWPSGPTASRTTFIHARSSGLARRASKPVRGQAAVPFQ